MKRFCTLSNRTGLQGLLFAAAILVSSTSAFARGGGGGGHSFGGNRGSFQHSASRFSPRSLSSQSLATQHQTFKSTSNQFAKSNNHLTNHANTKAGNQNLAQNGVNHSFVKQHFGAGNNKSHQLAKNANHQGHHGHHHHHHRHGGFGGGLPIFFGGGLGGFGGYGDGGYGGYGDGGYGGYGDSVAIVDDGLADEAVAADPVADVDLELLGVQLVDAGSDAANQGPLYRMNIRNNSDVAVTDGFDVALVATNGEKPNAKSPIAKKRIEAIKAGQTLSIEMRLPAKANHLHATADGGTEPFKTLIAAVDLRGEIDEVSKDNNLTKVARTEVPALADAVASQ